MGDPRPMSAGGDDPQDEQYELVRESGNAPTADDEEELLRVEFGEPDEHGVYGAAGGDS